MLSGNYLINAASGKVLDEPACSTTLGAVIDQCQITGGTNQQWQIVPLSNGYQCDSQHANQLAPMTRTTRPVACTRPVARPRSGSGSGSLPTRPSNGCSTPNRAALLRYKTVYRQVSGRPQLLDK